MSTIYDADERQLSAVDQADAGAELEMAHFGFGSSCTPRAMLRRSAPHSTCIDHVSHGAAQSGFRE